ncbi:MAG: winged helix-turn-helix transcriptional regulator [Nannocystales bacterium]
MTTANNDSPHLRAPIPAAQCGLAKAADLLADRVMLLVLREMLYGVTRFDDLHADLGCSRSVLSSRLKRLQELGLVTKQSYQEAGQRVRQRYRLTPAAGELGIVFAALMDWGARHLDEPAAQIRHRTSGLRLRAALVDSDGNLVQPTDATIASGTEAPGDPEHPSIPL